MIYVAEVTSTVKDGVGCRLGPKTVIVGPNGSGKSSVVDSISLATAGGVFDLNGRPFEKRDIELRKLSTKLGGRVVSKVILRDTSIPVDPMMDPLGHGVVGEAEWSVSDLKGEKSAKWNIPACVSSDVTFPLRSLKEALAGSAETVRKFFLQQVCRSLSVDAMLAQIPTVHHEKLKQVSSGPLSGKSPVEILLDALEGGQKKQRDLNAREANAEKAAAQNAPQGVLRPTDEQVRQAEANLADARAILEKVVAQETRLSTYRSMQHANADQAARSAEFVTNLEEKKKLRSERQTELDQLPTIDPSESESIDACLKLLKYTVEKGHKHCIQCGDSNVPDGVFKNRLDKLMKSTETIQSLQATRGRLSAEIRHLDVQIASLEAVVNRDQSRSSQLTEPEVDSNLPAIGPARTNVDKAQQEMVRVKSDRSLWDSAQSSKEEAAKLRVEAMEWGLFTEEIRKVQIDLLNEAVVRFATRVQKYLPKEDVFSIRLNQDDREGVVEYGFVKNGLLYSALSGAEGIRMTMALALTCAEEDLKDWPSSTPRPLMIVVPDDRGLDEETVSRIMESTAGAPLQIILATPTQPKRMVDGWVVIHTEKDEHRGFAPAAEESVVKDEKKGKGRKPSVRKGKVAPAESPATTVAPAHDQSLFGSLEGSSVKPTDESAEEKKREEKRAAAKAAGAVPSKPKRLFEVIGEG